MKWFVCLFVLYLMAEFGLLFVIGRRIGFFSLVGLMGLSAILGLFLLKKSKLAGLLSLRNQRQGHSLGLFELLWPVRFALVGILLILPGFIGDFFALLLLLPIKGPEIKVPTRGKPQATQAPHFSDDKDFDREYFQANQTGRESTQGEVIDVEYVKVSQKKSPD
jgi:UPF0716 protein FxsA